MKSLLSVVAPVCVLVALASCSAPSDFDDSPSETWNTANFVDSPLPPPGQPLTLSHDPLVRGEQVQFTITSADPFETVYVLHAPRLGAGTCPPIIGGRCLGIRGPVSVLRSATANAAGVATFRATIPSGLALTDVALQAAAVRGPQGSLSVLSNPELAQFYSDGGGGAELLPDEIGVGAGPDPWRPAAPVVLNCPWMPQVPPGDWDNTKNCGPTSLILGAACVDPATATVAPAEILDIVDWMDANIGGYNATTDNGAYTNTSWIADTAVDFYGFSAAHRFTSGTLQMLYDELSNDRPVIIPTFTQASNNYPSDVMVPGGDGHFVLLVGMTSTHVVFNDPGRSASINGQNRYFTINSFLPLWQSRSGVMLGGAAAPLGCPGDTDGDGYGAGGGTCVGTGDCSEGDPTVHPGAAEACDMIDNNCNGVPDEGCAVCVDHDGDLYGTGCGAGTDCDDNRAATHPGATETCGDNIDNDCDAQIDEGCVVCVDLDGDSHGAGCAAGNDCNDNNRAIFNGAAETADFLDNDCDLTVDEGFRVLFRRIFWSNGLAATNPAADFDHAFASGSVSLSPVGGGTQTSGGKAYVDDGVQMMVYDPAIGNGAGQINVGTFTLAGVYSCYLAGANEHVLSFSASLPPYTCTSSPVGYVKTGAASGTAGERTFRRHYSTSLSDNMYSTTSNEGSPQYSDMGVLFWAWAP